MESPNVIKKFTCEICERAFSTNQNKKRHISTFHGEVKMFDCNVCSKKFGRNDELMGHIENNHKVKDQKCRFEFTLATLLPYLLQLDVDTN